MSLQDKLDAFKAKFERVKAPPRPGRATPEPETSQNSGRRVARRSASTVSRYCQWAINAARAARPPALRFRGTGIQALSSSTFSRVAAIQEGQQLSAGWAAGAATGATDSNFHRRAGRGFLTFYTTKRATTRPLHALNSVSCPSIPSRFPGCKS
jgi:hypothetical protein